jgi:hypothetical protein
LPAESFGELPFTHFPKDRVVGTDPWDIAAVLPAAKLAGF